MILSLIILIEVELFYTREHIFIFIIFYFISLYFFFHWSIKKAVNKLCLLKKVTVIHEIYVQKHLFILINWLCLFSFWRDFCCVRKCFHELRKMKKEKLTIIRVFYFVPTLAHCFLACFQWMERRDFLSNFQFFWIFTCFIEFQELLIYSEIYNIHRKVTKYIGVGGFYLPKFYENFEVRGKLFQSR